ncbi:Profilin like protein [Aduncisulcus paluster]|uniref:Profilin like protein n=1 Tax=Aduncisulcus paluster TaxID=2918883 RepID=A0ABQ5L0U2_9EUKA|nr:Profilin like protein [Aduncisulcus paluster]|eukprot:gnl/Carplike_NY0171/607_a831_2314.p1 GENE.gnl/Carplike_NY0171/607_a831_2314~~gnl/Carplike_NY0171/607_a831_2314.p1  ORF type:complete len:154 (+),score=33.07 gnl/Carplike_NY0171/607_a831_2314:42-503(+)
MDFDQWQEYFLSKFYHQDDENPLKRTPKEVVPDAALYGMDGTMWGCTYEKEGDFYIDTDALKVLMGGISGDEAIFSGFKCHEQKFVFIKSAKNPDDSIKWLYFKAPEDRGAFVWVSPGRECFVFAYHAPGRENQANSSMMISRFMRTMEKAGY